MVGNYPIFIAHASEDEPLARTIYENLDYIVEFHPYLAQDFANYGEDFKERIQNVISQSRFFIVIFSTTAIPNQWVNQELGYACAEKKRRRTFRIIPLSQSHLSLKGFITRDSDDIIFYDKYSEEELIATIIFTIRSNIYNGLSYGNLRFTVRCQNCKDKRNLSTTYTPYLPDQKTLNEAITEDHTYWYTICPSCGEYNYSNIFTFKQIDGRGLRH